MLFEPLEPRTLLSGVTLVAHGQASGGLAAWVPAMADAIEARLAEPVTRLAITVTESGGSVTASAVMSGPAPDATASGEIIGYIDWSSLAGGLFSPTNDTYEVADAVAALMLSPTGVPGFGHALVELPIHLLGHSRGASLISEIARDLGRAGVWVDHLTMLDPYPRSGDAPAGVAQTVAFADNFYQTSSFIVNGFPIDGAIDRHLPSMTGGYTSGTDPNHSDVHLWYHGTIKTEGDAFDGEATLADADRPSWYDAGEALGQTAGFYYTRFEGGPLPAAGLHPALGGTESREAPDDANATQPSIVSFGFGSALPNSVISGARVPLDFIADDADSGATITFVLDTDRNPYNGNDAATIGMSSIGATPGAALSTGSFDWLTAGTASGTYFVSARISDGSHTRYAYSDSIHLFTLDKHDALSLPEWRSTSWIEPPAPTRPPTIDAGSLYWMG